MGDFNSIKKKEDRAGSVYNNRDSLLFNAFMKESDLLEIEGLNFSDTWFGPTNKKSKLDRVLVNEVWLYSGN